MLSQIKQAVGRGGSIVKVSIPTVFGTFIASYMVAGTIRSDQIVNVGMAIYSDASIRFEEWEQLFVLGLGTTFAIEDLPTHYLSYVEAATGMSKEDIFSHLGKVTGTDDDPPRTLWVCGDNTSKNRQMTPRVRINGMWLNVSWPDALTITPVSSNSGYWSYDSYAASYTPMDALDYLWKRGDAMDVDNSYQSCTRFGLWWGIRLACIYAGILGIVWTVSPAPLTVGFSERVFGLLWFWLYGCIVGSIIGGTGGAASGYILCKILMRLKPYIRGHAWVVGLAVHIVIWLIVHVTIGRLLLLEPGSRPLYQVFIGYPGIIYIAAGGVLSQYWYVKHII